jgi:hypothetical protein
MEGAGEDTIDEEGENAEGVVGSEVGRMLGSMTLNFPFCSSALTTSLYD